MCPHLHFWSQICIQPESKWRIPKTCCVALGVFRSDSNINLQGSVDLWFCFFCNRSGFAFGVWRKASHALQGVLNFQSLTPAAFHFLKTCGLYFYIFLYLAAQRHTHLNQQTGEELFHKRIKEPQRNSRTWHLLGMWLAKLWRMVKWVKKMTGSFMGGVEQLWGKGFFHVLGGYLAMIIMFQLTV